MKTEARGLLLRLPAITALLTLLSAGCASSGGTGWFRIEPRPGVFYGASLSPSSLNRDLPPCESLTRNLTPGDHPIYVFVHGFGGDNYEWHDVPPLLSKKKPAAMFMFRWSASGNRDRTEALLAAGVSHLVQCFAGRAHPVLLLAHSAGGLVASYAQRLITIPSGVATPAVYIMTVATPLAIAQTMALGPFPREADGVRVVHLRTSYPADPHMRPDNGRLPNDPSVGVVGARQIDLPGDVTHDGSIMYAARKLADGSWRQWFSNP